MTGLLNAAQSGFTVGSFQFDLYVFTDTYIFNTFETNMFKSVLHGFALRIQDCFLGSDNNFSFHIQKRALFRARQPLSAYHKPARSAISIRRPEIQDIVIETSIV